MGDSSLRRRLTRAGRPGAWLTGGQASVMLLQPKIGVNLGADHRFGRGATTMQYKQLRTAGMRASRLDLTSVRV